MINKSINTMDVNQEEQLVEERDELMIKSDHSTGPYIRKGYFLKPQHYLHGEITEAVPFLPKLNHSNADGASELACKVTFKGWHMPHHNWACWVDKMSRSHGDAWKQAGIYDAIQVSTYKIKKDLESFWEVVSYWNSETNTFIFPSFEATITLEDTMILGGLSPIGPSIGEVENLSGEFKDINLHLVEVHKLFNRARSKKANFYAWTNHFMEGNDGSLEHYAFLSLWLSRYVFPRPPGDIVQRELFPIAILLARGHRLALGPAVLASLYHGLSILASIDGDYNGSPIFLWAPFGILQMWIWDHFSSQRRNIFPKSIEKNKPWATRWHNLAMNRLPRPKLMVESAHRFNWRPYTETLSNWSFPSYYKDNGRWISNSEINDVWDTSFVQCVRACKLIGLDYHRLYLPHRVARQFGYDQDVSGCVRVSFRQFALSTYQNVGTNFSLYIPSRHSASEVTDRYYSWWNVNICHSNSSNDDDVVEKNKISSFLGKKQKLETHLNTTPLNGSLLEGVTRVNVRTIKALARTKKTSANTDVNHNHGAGCAAGALSVVEKHCSTPGAEDQRR